MNKFACLLLLSVVIACWGCKKNDSIPIDRSQPTKRNSLELTIKTQLRNYKINEIVPIECMLENNTQETALLHLKNNNYGWQLNVAGNGAIMFMLPSTPVLMNRLDFMEIKPGKKHSFIISLPNGVGGWHWNFKEPGDYIVTLKYEMSKEIVQSASRDNIDNVWYGKIISNAINITFTK